MNIYMVNESATLSDIEAARIAAALDHQGSYGFGRSGWHLTPHCFFLPGGADAKVPTGGAILHMLDTPDIQGALGYHDEDGNEVPAAKVFVQTAQQDGTTASEVASHEFLELAVDPHTNLTALTGDMSRLFALEVCDAVQGNPYPGLGGVILADFVLPSYFDPTTAPDAVTDYRSAIRGSFVLAPQGYSSYIDTANFGAGWQQVFGLERTSPPPWATRHTQRST